MAPTKPRTARANYKRFASRFAEPSAETKTRQSRGYGRRHEHWRARVLASDPVCHFRRSDGRLCRRSATVADHVLPKRLFASLEYDVANGQGLCAACHNKKTALEQSHVYVDTRERRESMTREQALLLLNEVAIAAAFVECDVREAVERYGLGLVDAADIFCHLTPQRQRLTEAERSKAHQRKRVIEIVEKHDAALLDDWRNNL